MEDLQLFELLFIFTCQSIQVVMQHQTADTKGAGIR